MGETTGISWCDHTFNPWIGCAKVSAGCTNCYAERDNNRYGWVEGWGENGMRRKTGETNWKKPLAWNEAARMLGVRRKVFCGSLCDVFEGRIELHEWRQQLWTLIIQTPHLDWLLLTKRPQNVMRMAIPLFPCFEERLPDNVWIGTTCENQETADRRIPILLDIPARVRFISVEPMLEEIDLEGLGCNYLSGKWSHYHEDTGDICEHFGNSIDWVICGGESGPNARRMNLEWARELQKQCAWSNTPFFFKQAGGMKRIEGKWGGDLLDGVRYHEFPKGG